MTPADLSEVINLGLLVLSILGVCFAANMCCPPDPKTKAWSDGQKALRRANRDVEQRERLRMVKE